MARRGGEKLIGDAVPFSLSPDNFRFSSVYGFIGVAGDAVSAQKVVLYGER